jgi:Leucine-rich repeat (LRR) protein
MVLLNLSNQNLTKIPIIPNDVTKLILSHNQITKIENLPDSLQELWLDDNQITKIENLTSSIQELWLNDNQIIKIENLPNSLQELHLRNNEITKIENLPENLQELYLIHNQITKIENLSNSLQILSLINNQITKIANLSNSIQTLYLHENQITKIENLHENLQTLYLFDNQITKIENLPNSLQILWLHSNQITKIENLSENLHTLYLFDNQILELPLSLLELRHLNRFNHYDNPIENIHPLVQRWLDRLNRRTNDNNKVYSDKQNIHNSTIQKSFRNSLENLLKDKNTLSLEECKKHVLECDKLEEQTKRELLNYCDDETEHSVYLVKFDEVFKYVVSRIVGHSDSTEIFKILNEEIKDTICKCFTGRMTRIVNVLNGFYGDISIQIGSNEQISNIIIMLKEKYEGDELVKQVRLEMEERDYDKVTIEEWLTYVEE